MERKLDEAAQRVSAARSAMAGRAICPWECEPYATGGGRVLYLLDAEVLAVAYISDRKIETEEQSRQRFKSWLLSCGEVRKYLERDSNGRYRDNDTHVAWQAWQASQSFREASE